MVMVYVWLGIFIATLVIEIISPALVSIWFSAGSLVSLILAAFLGEKLIWLQVLVFILVSAVTIIILRPLIFRNKKSLEKTKTNVDSLQDKVGKALEKIEKFNPGTVKVQGLVWSAEVKENYTDVINPGDLVTIKEIVGNKLIVEKYIENKEEN